MGHHAVIPGLACYASAPVIQIIMHLVAYHTAGLYPVTVPGHPAVSRIGIGFPCTAVNGIGGQGFRIRPVDVVHIFRQIIGSSGLGADIAVQLPFCGQASVLILIVLRNEYLAAYILSVSAYGCRIVVELERPVPVSVIGHGNQQLLRVIDCRQPVLRIVLVTDFRLISVTLRRHVSIGVIGEGILLRQVALAYGCLGHLVIRVIGVCVLPGFQIAVQLLFLSKDTVSGLVILIGIGHLVKLALALPAFCQLAVRIIGKGPLGGFPLRILVLPWIILLMIAFIPGSALVSVILFGCKQALLCCLAGYQARVIIGILVVRYKESAYTLVLQLRHLVIGIVGNGGHGPFRTLYPDQSVQRVVAEKDFPAVAVPDYGYVVVLVILILDVLPIRVQDCLQVVGPVIDVFHGLPGAIDRCLEASQRIVDIAALSGDILHGYALPHGIVSHLYRAVRPLSLCILICLVRQSVQHVIVITDGISLRGHPADLPARRIIGIAFFSAHGRGQRRQVAFQVIGILGGMKQRVCHAGQIPHHIISIAGAVIHWVCHLGHVIQDVIGVAGNGSIRGSLFDDVSMSVILQ